MGRKGKQSPDATSASVCRCCGGSGKVVVLGACPLCDGVGQFVDQPPQLPDKAAAKAAKARVKDISQTLSMLLRHQAREKDIQIDDQGWVLMTDALECVNGPEMHWDGVPVTLDEVRAVASDSDKQRFAIWEQEPIMIRASQGHTMPGIDPNLDPVNLDEVALAVHGTYYAVWEIIKAEGLNRMERNHIHLAKDLPGASGVVSGMRGSCQVLIWVDLVKASAAGIKFVQSANGVILSEGRNGVISPEYFIKVVDRKTNKDLK